MTERKVDGKIASAAEAAMQTQLAMDELMDISGQNHNFNYEKILVEKDGKMIEVEVPIDDIDLVSDFDDEDLTEEGYRSLGMIDKDYDSTSEDGYQLKSRKKLPVVVVEVDEDDMDQELEIKCPYTGSTNLYQIDAEMWASYETDQPFVVILKSKNED
jgi:hypothetical protein